MNEQNIYCEFQDSMLFSFPYLIYFIFILLLFFCFYLPRYWYHEMFII